jgi:hypothetical protein
MEVFVSLSYCIDELRLLFLFIDFSFFLSMPTTSVLWSLSPLLFVVLPGGNNVIALRKGDDCSGEQDVSHRLQGGDDNGDDSGNDNAFFPNERRVA